MGSLQSYSYDELTSRAHVRLVRLLPGKSNDQLQCEILAVDLYNNPHYEAISYVWGSEERSCPLTVRSFYGDRSLQITRNLFEALLAFREANSSLDLWADSICINQDSMSERHNQVRLMGDIYRLASRVRVWLAYPDELAQETRDCLLDVCQMTFKDEARAHYLQYEILSEMDNLSSQPALEDFQVPSPDKVHLDFDLPPLESPEFQQAVDLLNNTWFSRAWTWQENFLARKRTFYMKPYVFDDIILTTFCMGLRYLRRVTGDERYSPNNNADSWSFSVTAASLEEQYGNAAYKLATLIPMQRGKGCKEAHDLIYSVLGVAEDYIQVEVDYQIPVEVIFAKCAWEIMQYDESLSLLGHVLEDQASPGLPTWAPDWRMEANRNKLPIDPWFTDSYEYSATGSSHLWAALSSDAKILTVRGVELDRIFDLRSHDKYIPLALDIEDFHELGDYSFTQEPYYRAILRTWFLDTTRYTNDRPVTRWQPESGDEIDKILFRWRTITKSEALNRVKLAHGVKESVFDRLMLITKEGMIGLCPKTTQKGDVVALLLGGSVPYILRPAGTLDHYKFVGECYVHGFMDGEGLSDAWRAANSCEELMDTSWINDLRKDAVPSKTKEFHLI